MPMRIKIKKLESYDGSHNAKLFDNLYWDIEQYLEQLNGSADEAKVNATTMFLIGTTKLWWRNRAKDLTVGRIAKKIKN
jgi:hypothetical protein